MAARRCSEGTREMNEKLDMLCVFRMPVTPAVTRQAGLALCQFGPVLLTRSGPRKDKDKDTDLTHNLQALVKL